MPLAVAMLSVAFQQWTDGHTWSFSQLIIFVAALLCLKPKTSQLGVALFIGAAAFRYVPTWITMANHIWLALWTIPVAIFFKQWWRSDLYSLYLRVTMGIVMLAAFAQKVLAGTYVDGSYLYFLSIHGSPTERIFSFACDLSTGIPCLAHKLIGQFILVWQLVVGVLLLLGIRSLMFLSIEIGFLLGAGLFADEMNFQVLNIALLCMVFKVGMPIWLLLICTMLLVVDVIGLGDVYRAVMHLVA